jgi:hypothetical protein
MDHKAENQVLSEIVEAYATALTNVWDQAMVDLDGKRDHSERPLASKVFDILIHDAPGAIVSEAEEDRYKNHDKPRSANKAEAKLEKIRALRSEPERQVGSWRGAIAEILDS